MEEKPARLVVGRDYPRMYREFVEVFPDDEACAAYLERLRWPHGFVCPACGVVSEPWRQSRGRLVCTACRHQTTPTAGTILGKTRTPLTTWFEAAWHLTTAKNGMSAKTLERTLGTSYRVAWMMLQRYRVAMVRAERGPQRLTVHAGSPRRPVEHQGQRQQATRLIAVLHPPRRPAQRLGRELGSRNYYRHIDSSQSPSGKFMRGSNTE